LINAVGSFKEFTHGLLMILAHSFRIICWCKRWRR